MTTLAHAFSQAGYVPTADRLKQAALDAWRAHPQSSKAAREALCRTLRADPELLWELFAASRERAINELLACAGNSLALEYTAGPNTLAVPGKMTAQPAYMPQPETRSAIRSRAKREEKAAAQRREMRPYVDKAIAELTEAFRCKEIVESWKFSNGIALLVADRTMLQEEVLKEEAFSSEHRIKGRFYKAIMDVLPSGKTVQQGVAMDRLGRLYEEAFAVVPPQ